MVGRTLRCTSSLWAATGGLLYGSWVLDVSGNAHGTMTDDPKAQRVKIAKLLGAGRVAAAGRNQQVLSTLHKVGADATINLDVPTGDLGQAFAPEAGDSGFQVVIDYVSGPPRRISCFFISAASRYSGSIFSTRSSCWRARRG